MQLHNPATLAIELRHIQHGFGALQAHLVVHSSIPACVTQANQPLDLTCTGERRECDVTLVPGDPLTIDAENAHMLLIYPGNRFVQVNEQEGATLTTSGIEVIEVVSHD